jgi:cation diffusion facilitator CzcD-associated flavoprotein CzcO
VDRFANRVRRALPRGTAHRLLRWRNLLLDAWVYYLCTRQPAVVKKWFLDHIRGRLGPDYDVETDFSPRYKPLEQRICVDADGKLFEAIRSGRASVVTDEIESFTESGLKLKSGAELEADLVVTATGFNMQLMDDLEVVVDGRSIDMPKTLAYRGMMFSEVPNLASSGLLLGHFAAPWTAKAELVSGYVCRLLNHMQRSGARQCTPRLKDQDVKPAARSAASSGYILRAVSRFPSYGLKKPWRLDPNYFQNRMTLSFGDLEDGTMDFSSPPVPAKVPV